MEITILVDHDLEGMDVFLAAGLRETGWDQLIRFEFKRLRDYGLPDRLSDQEIWRFAQQQRLLIVTNNRNNDGEHSLEATIQQENFAEALPVVTISDKNLLARADYRDRVATRLAEIVIYRETYQGAGRLFAP
jgi:predicted nuclease of predicted toxin-antitoxin system